MKVIIKISGSGVVEDIPWIYIGQNSIKMLRLEKKLIGNRISLGLEIYKQSILLRPQILKWLARQGDANSDALSWQSTNLGSRVNFTSNFFINLYQVTAVKAWLSKNEESFPRILVICENLSLAQCIRANISTAEYIDNKCYRIFHALTEILDWTKKFLKVFLSQIVEMYRHALAAKLTRPKSFQYPNGEIYIVHQCLDDMSFSDRSNTNCRYLSELPQWLENQGKQVFRLPWFSNVSGPLPGLYAKIRAHNSFIPHDWIGLDSYITALWSGLRNAKSIDVKTLYPNINVLDLLKMEKSAQILYGLSTSKFWLLKKSLQKFLRNVDNLVLIQFFENHPPEHFLISFSREVLEDRVKAVGYYHSLISKDYLAYHFLPNDDDSQIFPDIIVTNGSLGLKLLEKQGLKSSRMRLGPALRNNRSLAISSTDGSQKNGLLVLLPIYLDAACELLVAVSFLAEWIELSLKIPVYVKAHPMMPCEQILGSIGWGRLPKSWTWEKGELSACLNKVKCAITVSSASIIDVVLSGCVPVPFARALDIPRNYLDILEIENIFFEPVGSSNLKNRLEDIYINKVEQYIDKTSLARVKIEEGLNPVNDQLLKNFIA